MVFPQILKGLVAPKHLKTTRKLCAYLWNVKYFSSTVYWVVFFSLLGPHLLVPWKVEVEEMNGIDCVPSLGFPSK